MDNKQVDIQMGFITKCVYNFIKGKHYQTYGEITLRIKELQLSCSEEYKASVMLRSDILIDLLDIYQLEMLVKLQTKRRRFLKIKRIFWRIKYG